MRAFVRVLLLCCVSSLLLRAADEARLLNIATRTQVGGAAGTPVLGFVVRGTATPRILVRAVGPGLAPFGITQWLADPQLTLISGGTKVASNDNWQAVDGATMTAVGAFSLPTGSKDSAIVAALPAADYSAPLASGDGKTGVGLLEVYDASGLGTGSLINASTLSFVGTGDALLIPGFVIGGQGNLRMLIRAVGPGLATFGVTNLLADPTLTLYRDGAPLTANDDWSTVGSSADVAAAAKAAGAFDLKAGSKDAALLVSLPAGAYTAVVSGVGGTTGMALVELYAVAAGDSTPLPLSVAITTPSSAVVTANATLAVQGTSAGPSAGVTGVSVNGVVATSSDGFATWSANVPLGFGSNLLTATVTGPTGNAVSKSVAATLTTPQAYNPLVIPEAITGPDFDLTLATATKQFRAGSATPTIGFNGALFWGPTLIMNRGDVVRMKVHNALTATTTVHWHGFHLPAAMDGGPLQPILPGATWSPSWTVKNSAATYWYHPHLHETTQEQLTKGAGGLIIVRDPEEAALGLPRTYGVDDIPLAVTSRRFLTDNSFAYDHIVDNYGDYVLVNGTLNPRANLPRQFVRLRVLNAEIERGYNLGFSDNRTFYVIGNDSGLLDAPVAVTRVKLMVGERVEILVNLGNDAVGGTVDLRAFNSGQVFGFPGNEGNPVQPTGRSGPINGSLLNNTDFNLLRINVVAATANPVTSLPGTLIKNTYWTNAQVTNTRTVTITGGGGGSEFTFDGAAFSATRNNFTVKLNAIERWTIVNNNIFGHAFHVHDVKFKVVARTPTVGQVSTDGLPAPYESGWKDTVYVPKGESVQVIAKFEDYASTTDAYMFHCHFANHEDGGMMGRFVVYDPTIATDTRAPAFRLQPQPMAAAAGATVRLRAEVDSASATSYQWYFRGGEFCNTEHPVLELRDLTLGHSGEYFCVATNPFGSTRSKSATLTVAPAAVVPLAVMPQP